MIAFLPAEESIDRKSSAHLSGARIESNSFGFVSLGRGRSRIRHHIEVVAAFFVEKSIDWQSSIFLVGIGMKSDTFGSVVFRR